MQAASAICRPYCIPKNLQVFHFSIEAMQLYAQVVDLIQIHMSYSCCDIAAIYLVQNLLMTYVYITSVVHYRAVGLMPPVIFNPQNCMKSVIGKSNLNV